MISKHLIPYLFTFTSHYKGLTFFFIYTIFKHIFKVWYIFFFIYDLYITYSPFIFVIWIKCLLWISITNGTKQRSARHYGSLPPEFLLLSRQTEVMLDGFLLGLVWMESNTYRVRIIFSVHVVSLHKQIHLNKQLTNLFTYFRHSKEMILTWF